MDRIRLEPKYCELCGALWLRPAGSSVTYCPACSRRLEHMAHTTGAPQGRAQ